MPRPRPVPACVESAAAGEVAVAIKDFAFGPADIQAKVGQTVTFTNGDSAPHTATLDDGTCATPNIAGGGSDGLMFSAAGRLSVPLQRPSEHEGHDHGQLTTPRRAGAASGALDHEEGRA